MSDKGSGGGDPPVVGNETERSVDTHAREEELRVLRRRLEFLQSTGAERLQLEQDARDQREILESVVLHLGDGVVVADDNGKFLLFNPAAERILGLGMTDAPPERWSEVYGVFLPDRVTPFPWKEYPLVRSLSGNEVRDVEMFIRHAGVPDGVSIRVTGTPLRRDGVVWGAVVVFRDTTQQERAEHAHGLLELAHRQAEERRRVEAELETLRDSLVRQTRFSAIGELAASIAHDLRNPLGAIRNSRFYLSRQVPPDRQDWARQLDIIEQETRTADRIIDNLLDMSRSKMPEKEKLELAAIVREAFGHDYAPRGIVLELRLDPDPFEIWADPSQLRRLFANLLINAAQAMDGTGKIVLEARRDAERSIDTIRVTDAGCGIPNALRERIFEPLFTTRAKGTGLGLAICRQISERHGGSIDLAETGPTGSTFVVRLPTTG